MIKIKRFLNHARAHGVGLAGGHEIPLIQEFNMMKAASGMVFAIDAGPGPGAIKKQICSGFGH